MRRGWGRAPRHTPDLAMWCSAAVLALLLLAALLPWLLAPGDPLAIDPRSSLRPPGALHPFGTDESGRDLYTRVVHGARASLSIGALATAIGLGLGVVLGAAAALGPRWLDWAVGRVLEVGFAFPGILLALLVIALWGPGVVTSTIAVGLSTAPGYARVVRGTMLGVRRSAYVEAEVVLGRSWTHRLVHTVLPNTLAPLFALATLGLGQAIVWASSLAFLGLGEPPPSPEWGAMLSAGRTYLLTGAWWLTVVPGTAIVIAAVAATVFGRGLQRRTRAAGSRRPDTRAEAQAAVAGDMARDACRGDGGGDEPVREGAVLSVRGLRLAFGDSQVLRGAALDLVPGRVLAMIGPSGAGKSALSRALIGLAGEHAMVEAAALSLRDGDGTLLDLRAARDHQWRRVRGSHIGLVLQDALVALDPLRTIGAELDEALGRLPGVDRAARRSQAIALLERAGLDDAHSFLDRRADELSGGQRQRALIATAIARDPRILIADEPTASLDPATRDAVLGLIRSLADDGVAVLLVTHDHDAVAAVADEVLELRDGRLAPPSASASAQRAPALAETSRSAAPAPTARDAAPIVSLSHVSKSFGRRTGQPVGAVIDASIDIAAGEIVGLVGASGSGKSTLGRLILGLTRANAGTIAIDGPAVASPGGRRALRGLVGHVPQDALSSFDPRRTVGAILADASSGGTSRSWRRHRSAVAEALAAVGLPFELAARRPLHLSGGQRQRVAIARALAASPRLLVCDEAVSALDPASRDDIIELLARLRKERGVAMLFISHDPAVTARLCDRVLRMSAGRVDDER